MRQHPWTAILGVAAILLLVAGSLGHAQSIIGSGQPIIRYYAMTISSTVIKFPAERLLGRNGQQATQCSGKVETAQIRIGMQDIITPTTTVGAVGDIGDMITITGYDNLVRFMAIRTGSSDATIKWFCAAATLQ